MQSRCAGRYPEFGPAGKPQDGPLPPASDSDDWAAATELAAEALRTAMRQWAAAGRPVPEVGFELADDKGQVRTEAELAWPTKRMAVLHGERAEGAAAFKQADWRVFAVGKDGEGAEQAITEVVGLQLKC